MIVSLDKVKKHITTTLPDDVLVDKLEAIEMLTRQYTNNNFQQRSRRTTATIKGGKITAHAALFIVGDNIEISESKYSNGVYSVKEVKGDTITTDKPIMFDEEHATLTAVVYPADVQQGAINLLKWDIENRDKVGIASETISRHSVSYFNMDGENSKMGYPNSLIGFLKPYKKARF